MFLGLEGHFFMSKDSKNLDILSDAELICLYKDGDETAESILVYRYRGFSFILAKAMYESYGSKFYLDVDDLASIALYALFVAIEKYNGKAPFYPYWKKVAQHKMAKHITDASSFYKNILISRDDSMINNSTDSITYFSSGSNALGKFDIYNQIIEILREPDNEFTEEELNIFFAYLDGYSINDLVDITGYKYYKIRKIVDEIKKKLRKYLHY